MNKRKEITAGLAMATVALMLLSTCVAGPAFWMLCAGAGCAMGTLYHCRKVGRGGILGFLVATEGGRLVGTFQTPSVWGLIGNVFITADMLIAFMCFSIFLFLGNRWIGPKLAPHLP